MVLLRVLIVFILSFNAAFAVVPDSIQTELKKYYPDLKFRFDNLMQVKDRLWLLLLPKQAQLSTEPPTLLLKTDREDFLFSNGWIYTPIQDHTIKSLDYYPEQIQKQLMQNQVTQEFLIPKKFTLPRDLANTAGRLPLELSNIELASERELIFRKKLLEAKETLPAFLIYSAATDNLDLINLDNSLLASVNGSNIANLAIKQSFANNFTYVSKVKNIKGSVYISDFHQGKIYKISKPIENKPDVTKPLELDKFVPNSTYNQEVFLDLANYEIKSKLVDFVISNDDNVIYLLTTSPNELLVVHTRDKHLIKHMPVPAGSDELTILSRSASEPDKIFFRSRSANKVFVLNSFDYNVASEIDLTKLDEKFLFIPHAFAVFPNQILLSVEAVAKNSKDAAANGGKVLVLDVITHALTKTVDLNFVPYGLENLDQSHTALIYGYNSSDYYSQIASLDIADYSLDLIDLGADFPAIKNVSHSMQGSLILVPSPATNLLGIIDTKTFSLIKKVQTAKPINFIVEI